MEGFLEKQEEIMMNCTNRLLEGLQTILRNTHRNDSDNSFD